MEVVSGGVELVRGRGGGGEGVDGRGEGVVGRGTAAHTRC